MKANYTLYTRGVRAFFALTLICVFGYVQAQQDNVWVIHEASGLLYTLDFNYIPPELSYVDTTFAFDSDLDILSNFNGPNGQLQCFTGPDGKLYDSFLKLKYNYDEFSAYPTNNITIPLVSNGQDYMIGIAMGNIGVNASIEANSYFLSDLSNKKLINHPLFNYPSSRGNQPYRYYETVPYNGQYSYIIGQYYNSLRSVLYDPVSNTILSDTVFVENIALWDISFGKPLVASPDFTRIAFVRDTKVEGEVSILNATLDICTFDKSTGRFSEIRTLLESREIIDDSDRWPKIKIESPVFSADSKYVFISTVNNRSSADRHLYRINIATGVKEDLKFSGKVKPLMLKLGPDGKIYLIPYQSELDDPNSRYIGVVNDPSGDDWKSSVSFNEKHLDQFIGLNKWRIVVSLPRTNGYYVKVNFEESNACAGLYTSFENTSDSTHFERYRFYFGDGDSAEIDDDNKLLLAGIDNIPNEDAWGVRHRYTKAGTYLVKLRVFNAVGGWVWYSHEVVVVESSIPKFSVADTIGCEWIAYQIQDLSRVVNKGKDIMYHWTFGDGTDSTELNPRTNTRQYKTYSQSGDYKIQLTIDDGYCIDSFSLNNTVQILEAPRPGITAAPAEGCSPVRVEVNTTYSDVRDSVIYTWGDGTASTSILGESSHTYLLAAGVSTSQYLTIYQSIHGPTGCVTTDSQTVIVHPGFLSADTPYLSLVTVNPDQQIEITWDSFPGATGYQLFRNGAWLADAATSNYTDASTKESLHEIATYTIYGTNVCEEKTLQSNIGQNIVLTGKGSEDNTISFLEWTPYQKWENGVVDYAIAVQNDDNSFTEIYRENANGTKKYTDETFLASALSGFATYKCYRIAAYELDYPQQISYSNVECVPFKPVIFIPTAITPNGDNLNDVYRPVTFGIEFYEVKVYNRYGQLIADFDQNSKGWNAADAPTGAYMVTIRAKGTDNQWYDEKSTVTVVR
jgi:gliding motility-associated-like protein